MAGSGRAPGGGHSNPAQYSCLENPVDRGAWRATVHGVAQSHTRLERLSMHARCKAYRSRKTLNIRNNIFSFLFFKLRKHDNTFTEDLGNTDEGACGPTTCRNYSLSE